MTSALAHSAKTIVPRSDDDERRFDDCSTKTIAPAHSAKNIALQRVVKGIVKAKRIAKDKASQRGD